LVFQGPSRTKFVVNVIVIVLKRQINRVYSRLLLGFSFALPPRTRFV
jgi:hypothetical protein